MKKTYYMVADIMIAIEGDNKNADALRQYFRNEEVCGQGRTEKFLIKVDEELKETDFVPEYYSLSGTIAFNEKEYRVRKKNYVYRVKNLFSEEKTVLSINWLGKRAPVGWLLNHMKPKSIGVYREADIFENSVMNYEVFWYIFAMELMKHDKVFVHSGIVSCGEEAIVIAGTGGCGKTSTLLQLLDMPGFKYIAEDFGIIGGNGKTYFMPKKAAIYESDAKWENRYVVHALEKMKTTWKFYWNIFKLIGTNPRHRFNPYELLGDVKINKEANVRKVVYMARKESDRVNQYEIKPVEAIEKIMDASFRELPALYEILCNIRAVGDEKIREEYPSLDQIRNRYRVILSKAFQDGLQTGLLEVPFRADPAQIARILREEDV